MIDWTKPIEWVMNDRRVEPVSLASRADVGIYPVSINTECGRMWATASGELEAGVGVIRNVGEPSVIDWTKPLELMDGRPVWLAPMGYHKGPNPDSDGDYWIEGHDNYRECIGSGGYAATRVRNRLGTPPTTGSAVTKPEIDTDLRDRFAMAALTGLSGGTFVHAENIARKAYAIADAMIAERKK